jgi:hypothetical protein
MQIPLIPLLAALLTVSSLAPTAAAQQADVEPVDFNRQIRPILSDNCFLCHGFDHSTREADLRLDIRDGALADMGGYSAVVPGDLEESELWFRINSDRKKEVMPPAKTGKVLTAEQKDLLKRWIEGGAEYTAHWAFVPPKDLEPPARTAVSANKKAWKRSNGIDGFIQSRLEDAGLRPSPTADKQTLIRRVTLDLTGLPPTPKQVSDYLADRRPGAYQRVVERLLSSSAHAEHMSRHWLDAARYGDTHGLHLDNYRSMYRYRDWLIQAFERNMPYDQFVTEQLAGDLIPDPTLNQKLATGFVRCNATSAEGGMIAEEFLAKYAMDRVDTFGTVFMGMSIGCAQCHDHKFDPVTQDEYFQLFAFFNNIAESASDQNIAAPPPVLRAPYPEQEARLAVLDQTAADQRAFLEAPMPEADAKQRLWQAEQLGQIKRDWYQPSHLELSSQNGTELVVVEDGYVLAQGANPDKEVFEVVAQLPAGAWSALRLEVAPDGSTPAKGVGRAVNSNVVMSGVEIEVQYPGGSEFHPVKIAQALADHQQDKYGTAGVLDDNVETGWALLPQEAKAHTLLLQPAMALQAPKGLKVKLRLRFESVHKQHVIGKFRLTATSNASFEPLVSGTWQESPFYAADSGAKAYQTAFAPQLYPNDVEWKSMPAYEDGKVHNLKGGVGATYLRRELSSPGDRTAVLSVGSDDAIQIWLNGDLVLERDVQRAVAADQDQVELRLKAGVNTLMYKVTNYGGGFGFYYRMLKDDPGGLPLPVMQRLANASGSTSSAADEVELRNYFRRNFSPEWKERDVELQATLAKVEALNAEIPMSLVAQERKERRPARLLNRGQYDDPGHEVQPGTPGLFPPMEVLAPLNASALANDSSVQPIASRMDLANWLFRDDHPLTARVQANRLWQMLFGVGLVSTIGDFGAQGDWPSHPKLLDWLAAEFQQSGWDQRHMLRLMVTSATYMQDSGWSDAKAEVDGGNRLLSRGPRFRLDAEVIRDSALAASGLLVDKIGGPSVKPYQPEGLWKAVGYTGSNTANFARDKGDALYRRSMYTFWKRTSPPPTMNLFDAPTRESCNVQRERTNTPLQALALWNDTQFVEAARVMATGMMQSKTPFAYAYQRLLARQPRAEEVAVLKQLLERQLHVFANDPEGAMALLEVGEKEVDAALNASELAAWTSVASVILNLDEAVTRL